MSYIIKIENKEQFDEVAKYFNRKLLRMSYPCFYYIMDDGIITPIEEVPIYTFKEWKLKFMKTNKSYICPFDLAEGIVKAGTLYKRYLDSPFYTPNGEFSQYSLPQEIVEQWQEAPQFKVGDYVVVKNNTPAAFGIVQEGDTVKWINNRSGYGYKWNQVRLATDLEILEARKYHLANYSHCYIFHNEILFNNMAFSLDYLLSCQNQLEDRKIVSITLRTDNFGTKDLILTKDVIDEIITKMKQC